MKSGRELSLYIRSHLFGLGSSMDMEFDRDDNELSRRMIYIAGPLFFSWLFIDWLYDSPRFSFYLLLRGSIWALSSFLAYVLLANPATASRAAKPIILSLFPIGYFIGIGLYPDQGVSASMVGGVIINIGIASLVLWRPLFFTLYILPFVVGQQFILFYAAKPLDLIMTNIVVSNITLGFGIFFTKSRYDLFRQSYRRKEEISKAKDDISASQKKLRTVLDSIDEAIISIDGSLKIGEDFSRGAAVLFSREKLTNASLASAVFSGSQLSEEDASIAMNALTMSIGNSALMWDLNSHTLPLELRVQSQGRQKLLSLLWSPIVDESKTEISGIVLSVRDETDKAGSRIQDEARNQGVDQRLAIMREVLESNVSRALRLVAESEEVLRHSFSDKDQSFAKSTDELKVFLRSLHTFKGVARSLNLSLLSAEIHSLEGVLASARRQHASSSVSDTMSDKLRPLRALLEQYSKVLQLFQVNANLSEEKSIASILYQNIPSLRESLQKEGFARASFTLTEDLNESLTDADFRLLEILLVHGLRNAADHGFVLPFKKGLLAVKDRGPKFHIVLKRGTKSTELQISDNGRGLDWEAIRKIATSRSFVPDRGENLSAILFQDGVTTAGRNSQSSGQGVGLSAIQAELRKRGGAARLVDSESGVGTTLSMTWQN
jgi:HPt (histidine-containing phosphotransfer) domain-containing protein